MARRTRNVSVRDRILSEMSSDKAREIYVAIMDGEVDADLPVIVANAKRRLTHVNKRLFRVGQRVRLNARTRPAKDVGKEGVITKVTPTRVHVMLDEAKAEFEAKGARVMTEAEAERQFTSTEVAVGVPYFMTPQELSISAPPQFLDLI